MIRAGGEIIVDYTEIESGKRADRPELRAALAEAERHKATLVIARLDRLGTRTRWFLQEKLNRPKR